jgi:hypothetical protein
VQPAGFFFAAKPHRAPIADVDLPVVFPVPRIARQVSLKPLRLHEKCREHHQSTEQEVRTFRSSTLHSASNDVSADDPSAFACKPVSGNVTERLTIPSERK